MDFVSQNEKKKINKRRFSPHLIVDKCTGIFIPLHTNRVHGRMDVYLHSFLTFRSLSITLRTTRFNFPKFYMVLTLGLRVLYGSHNKRRLLPYTILVEWFCVTEVESVYCAVRTESLYKTDKLNLERVNFGK